MSAIRLALMGIGDVRYGPPILASLASFFGERPIEIRMYDSDTERLDLLQRFAKVAFLMAHSTHGVLATESPEEALEDAVLIVLCVGENCAKKLLQTQCRDDESAVAQAIRSFRLEEHPGASILSLLPEPIGLESYYSLDWPPELTPQERASMPFQLLRWANGEEYPVDLLQRCERSPLNAWLENPTTAEYVTRA